MASLGRADGHGPRGGPHPQGLTVFRGTRPAGARRFRPVLALAVAAVALAALAGTAPAPAARAGEPAPPRDYAVRATFDALDASWDAGRGNSRRTGGALVWGGSYFLQSYLLMYEATGDLRYLQTFVAQADRILANRDSDRGLTDHRGRSLPAWGVGHPFTVGLAVLPDPAGLPVLEVASARPGSGNVVATVAPGTREGTITITAAKSFPRGRRRPVPTDVFADLTMDPRSPDYAVARINGAFEASKLQVTARDLRGPAAAGGVPAPGSVRLRAQRYVFPAHTGQLTFPLARFVRIVRETPGLRDDPGYRATADRFLAACVAAVAVHDEDWRETPAGEGFYVIPKGTPVRFDGAELPFNQALSLGRTLVELAALTGEEGYLRKVQAMARWLKGDLRVSAKGAYVWSYAWTRGSFHRGWTAEDGVSQYLPSHPGYRVAEDVDHGHIDIAFAVGAYRVLGPASGFTEADMQAFAATFVRNFITTDARGVPTVWDRVDASGAKGRRPNIPAAWMPLAAWDRAIFDHLYSDFNRRQPAATTPEVVFGTAYLNRFARRSRGAGQAGAAARG